jgi:TPR repeat protein
VSGWRVIAVLVLIAEGPLASAQSASSMFQLFNGLVGTAITQAALTEWRRLRPEELQCVDQRLRQNGQSIQGAIRQGITPDDPRVAGVRLACRTGVALTSPTFDCGRASLPDERTICTHPELAHLDTLVAAGYNYIRAVKGEQTARALGLPVLRSRRLCDSSVDCIREIQLSAIRTYRENGAPIELPGEQQNVPSIYSIDGFAVGGNVSQVGAYSEYTCKPSAQFASFNACERKQDEVVARGNFTSTYHLLHGQDGRMAYISRLLEPAWFSGQEAKEDISRQAKKYREQPQLVQLMPANTAGLSGMLATWGDLALRSLSDDEIHALLEGQKISLGLLVDYLGNSIRSLQLGLPVYEATGTEGFVYAASWNASGVGTLNFLAAAPSKLNMAVIAAGIDVKTVKAQELKTKFGVLADKARSGDVDAVLALSDAYMNGDGVEKNSANAIHWLKISADKGDPRALTKLALNMMTGNGIAKDPDAALKLLKSAADKNDAVAAFELGNLYDRGDVVAADAIQAFNWFEKASSLGSETANARIEEGRAAAEAARSVRNKLEDRLGSIKAENLRQRVFDQAVTLASANEHMTYTDLAKIRTSTQTANRLVTELEDLDRATKLADSLAAQVQDELKKITSDDPLVNQLQLNIQDVRSAIGSQDLSNLQSSMATLSSLFKANTARLRAMEFHAL